MGDGEKVREGTLLWEPSPERTANANITRYMRWLKETRGLDFASYEELYNWSVTGGLEDFWASVWDYFPIKSYHPYTEVLAAREMPGARWFAGAVLNYAEHALSRRDGHPAVLYKCEDAPLVTITYAELYRDVAALAASLRRLGVRRGDTVVGYLPNIPQALVAFLATASIGAVWSVCPPEFGARNTVDRFRQAEPVLLFAVDGYRYKGRTVDRREVVAAIQKELPTLKATVLVTNEGLAPQGLAGVLAWDELLAGEPGELVFEPVPFDHPLWVIYSSGTTGLPKAIVQGHGGILLEFLKTLGLHFDIRSQDRYLWFTTTGWMVWSFNTGVLTLGATLVMADGNPAYPDFRALWQLVQEAGVTVFGVAAPYLQMCRREGYAPGAELGLAALKTIQSSGAPLPPEGFAWVYDHVKKDVLLASGSGGTDVCSGLTAPCPLLPVYAGEMQCRALGVKADSYDEEGRSLIDAVGELVLTAPLPSMPLFFLNDPDGERYRESYFTTYPGVWRHGDWFKVTARGTCQVYGRSDATLKRSGVRLGTSEFYRVVESMPAVADSLVVDTSMLGTEGRILLFVVPAPGRELDDRLRGEIVEALRRELSPRHVPDAIYAVAAIPRTLNQKKLEVPVRRILTGTPPERAVNPDSLANPGSIAWFVELARQLAPEGPTIV